MGIGCKMQVSVSAKHHGCRTTYPLLNDIALRAIDDFELGDNQIMIKQNHLVLDRLQLGRLFQCALLDDASVFGQQVQVLSCSLLRIKSKELCSPAYHFVCLVLEGQVVMDALQIKPVLCFACLCIDSGEKPLDDGYCFWQIFQIRVIGGRML